MTEFCDDVIKLFPLRAIPDVIKLFRQQLNNREEEPDLTLLSIVTGLIEHSLTTKVLETAPATAAAGGAAAAAANHQHPPPLDGISNFPIIKYDLIEGLYKKFKTVLAPIEKLLV